MFKSITSRAARQFISSSRTSCLPGRYASSSAVFDWKDPLGSTNLYTEEELAIAETAEAYSQEQLLPRVLGVRYPDLPSVAI
jgi:glutaryl-CoA dehydrogenase